MDKTDLVKRVANLMRLADHTVQTSVRVNFREIDIVAQERIGLSRKTIFVECADYAGTVGVSKMQDDLGKLRAAQAEHPASSILMHVSRVGYTPEAAGYALAGGVEALTLADLTARLMNFDGYVDAVEADPLRTIIYNEYQATRVHTEGNRKDARPALEYMSAWLKSDSSWLTILGDYGVGKSWMLKRMLYDLVDKYKENPQSEPLPLFVPLQLFTKAIDFESLITTTLQHTGVATVNLERSSI